MVPKCLNTHKEYFNLYEYSSIEHCKKNLWIYLNISYALGMIVVMLYSYDRFLLFYIDINVLTRINIKTEQKSKHNQC